MKFKLLLTICAAFLLNQGNAQTFTGSGGAIPDSGAVYGMYPVNVSGIGIINSNFGLASVCVNITHPWDSDLEIYLKAPDGTSIALSIQNGGSGDDYTGTCFSATATMALGDNNAPFNGNFIPDDYMAAVNNGQNADGIWMLVVKDISPINTGDLLNWSINFSNALPPSPPACNGNLPPGNTCATATPICSFSGFCAATSPAYTADSWPELDYAFCGTVQNNAFVKFVATGIYMNFSIWVTSSINHDGIQMLFYDGGCGSGAVTEFGCFSPIRPGSSPNVISAVGLTPGNTYYLMIDGFAGDECNYVIELYPPANGLGVTASPQSVCVGQPVQLTATGGNGFYSWSGPGLSSNTGSNITATPTSTTTYSVSSIDPGGLCPVTKQVSVNVISLPASPSITGNISYCQRSVSSPLTATGSSLLWYNTAVGGTGNTTAPTPSTVNEGILTYYVSQTNVCESPRTPVNVLIKPAPAMGQDKFKTICYGTSTDLTREFSLGNLTGSWKLNGSVISPPTAASVSGAYQLEVINNEGCSDTVMIHLTVQQELHPVIADDTLAIKGIPFQLHCSPASGYTWSPASLLNASNVQNPYATITSDQQFIVQVTDAIGCTGTDSIFVKIYNGNTYYIPNAFSPNDDGVNDIFRAIPIGIKHTETFRVLNRYGRTIFETTDPYNKGWNGTYMGMKQSPGTYVWFIKGIDNKGKKIEMRGTVVLIL